MREKILVKIDQMIAEKSWRQKKANQQINNITRYQMLEN